MIKDNAFRRRLIQEAKQMRSQITLGNFELFALCLTGQKNFWIGTGERPIYTQTDNQSLIDLASSAGEHTLDVASLTN